MPDQVRHDEGKPVTIWDRALAEWKAAEAALGAAFRDPDQDRYDALLDAHLTALRRLLRTPVPDFPALCAKLDLIIGHQAWELSGSEACLAALQADARHLASVAIVPADTNLERGAR